MTVDWWHAQYDGDVGKRGMNRYAITRFFCRNCSDERDNAPGVF